MCTEVSFAGGFQEEEAFKDASAASIPTGLFGYRYIRPLTAPNGNKYTKETEEDMLDAIEAGDVILAPFVAPEGNMPGCGLACRRWSCPTGAKNLEAAYDYINWLMTDPEQNADWVIRAGGRLSPRSGRPSSSPTSRPSSTSRPRAWSEASACRPWLGQR